MGAGRKQGPERQDRNDADACRCTGICAQHTPACWCSIDSDAARIVRECAGEVGPATAASAVTVACPGPVGFAPSRAFCFVADRDKRTVLGRHGYDRVCVAMVDVPGDCPIRDTKCHAIVTFVQHNAVSLFVCSIKNIYITMAKERHVYLAHRLLQQLRRGGCGGHRNRVAH